MTLFGSVQSGQSMIAVVVRMMRRTQQLLITCPQSPYTKTARGLSKKGVSRGQTEQGCLGMFGKRNKSAMTSKGEGENIDVVSRMGVRVQGRSRGTFEAECGTE